LDSGMRTKGIYPIQRITIGMVRLEERIEDINPLMTLGLVLAFISPIAPWATYEVSTVAPAGTVFDDGNTYLSINLFSAFSQDILVGGLTALFLTGTILLLFTRSGLIAQYAGPIGFLFTYRDIVDVEFEYVQHPGPGLVLAAVATIICTIASIPVVERRFRKDNTRTDGRPHPDKDWMAHRGEVLHERYRRRPP
jgi:hypothetical protein